MNRISSILLACLAFVLVATNAMADVKVPPLFTDGMVLQRNTEAKVWGWADAGEEVTVSGSWGKSATVKAGDDGKWMLSIATPDAGGPFTLTIKGKNELKINDVMSGEVWICTGQSNMDCNMSFFKDTKKDIDEANFPNLRLFKVSHTYSPDKPLDNLNGKWAPANPESVKYFSATGYYFGLELYKKLNVPVGLIHCAWGGTRVEAWTPWEKQKDNPRLAADHERAQKDAETYDVEKEKKVLEQNMAKYKEELKKWEAGGKKGHGPWRPRLKDHPVKNPNYVSTLYNGMINPLAPYTIKGGVWYQGESNAWIAKEYGDMLALMIKSWREVWGQGDFPFYFVQLPGFQDPWKSPVEESASWAILREEFAKVAKDVPNTGMAITIDIGEAYDIHPQQKAKVGERLSRLALHNDYGMKDVVWTGPIMKSCEFKGDKAVVKFETGGSALAVSGGGEIKGFAVCDEMGLFHEAAAKIVAEDTVEVTSANGKPAVVYYAWAQNPEGVNLMNKEGLPASPFRFGTKPEVNLLGQVLPEVEKEYKLVYSIDPKNAHTNGDGTKYIYTKDNSGSVSGDFSRVAYFLGMRDSKGETKYILVELDPFTKDIKQIGVPDKASGARFQMNVNNVSVKSNVEGIKTGDFAEGCNIEFWDCNYGGYNEAKVPGADSSKYDFGDQMSPDKSPGYGCMQIHNFAQKQSLICFNNFRAGNADVGIGNSGTDKADDWTFTSAARNWSIVELKVLVK